MKTNSKYIKENKKKECEEREREEGLSRRTEQT